MEPPMPRRELARYLRDATPVGRTRSRRGRPADTYDLADIFRAHAEWVKRARDVGGA